MVELRDAFQGGWRWLVIAIPLVSAVVAGYLFWDAGEQDWEATGEFSIREYAPGEAVADIRAVTSSFEAALGSRRVADEIAAIDGVDPATSFVEVVSSGEGGDIEVALVASEPVLAEEALDRGVRRALTIVAEAESRRAARQLQAADDASADVIDVLLELETQAGAANLADEVARRSADILALRNQIASAEGNPDVQDALQRTLDEKAAELAVIEAELLPWSSANARLERAVASGAEASLRLRQIATGLADLEDQPILSSVRTTATSQLPDLLRVMVAAAAGAGLVIVVLALASGAGPGAVRRTRDGTGDDNGDGNGVRTGPGDELDERYTDDRHADDRYTGAGSYLDRPRSPTRAP